MRPVAIFRHARSEGPAYFATYLDRRGFPWKLFALDEGRPVPRDVRKFSGLAFMGGPMSVNDEHLPWVRPALELAREAVRNDVPMIGHCLGGQLMAKALGGEVTRAKVKEIGWGEVKVADNGVARGWFGPVGAFESFHWHGETFSIPPGGTRILGNAHCANQAFALGKHLGMQCHVEMTEAMVRDWCRGGADEIRKSRASPGVQAVNRIEKNLEERIAALHRIADRIYDRWSEGLARGQAGNRLS
jgi:GMP synthase-like glutamine amidotransferase